MKEKPILFSTPMVRAILDGRKTQTRRIAKVTSVGCKDGFITPLGCHVPRRPKEHIAYCPYGQPGDRLFVRECFRLYDGEHDPKPKMSIEYRADGDPISKMKDLGWKPSIHMPKWAARIWLEITGVRVERVQDISAEDAFDEGCNYRNSDGELCHDGGHPSYSILSFRGLWDSINGKRPGCAWQDNPWVWVIEFKRINKE